MRLSMRLGSAAAVTFCIAAVPSWGQENPLPDLFSDVIDVRVVNVEVVVTDKKGNRIRDLDAADFELRVDGESVPIDYFTEVDEGVPGERTGEPARHPVFTRPRRAGAHELPRLRRRVLRGQTGPRSGARATGAGPGGAPQARSRRPRRVRRAERLPTDGLDRLSGHTPRRFRRGQEARCAGHHADRGHRGGCRRTGPAGPGIASASPLP